MVVAAEIVCQGSCHGDAVGRWRVVRRADVAMRAGMHEMRRRIVAVVALAWLLPAMVPAARACVERDDGEVGRPSVVGGVGAQEVYLGRAWGPQSANGPKGSATILSDPLSECVEPLRRRVATITWAPPGAVTVAGDAPGTRTLE